MDPGAIIYLISGAILAGILIWGGLEWYAAILLGFIAPFVGLIMALPINMALAFALPASAVSGKSGADMISIISMLTSQVLVLAGAVLLAKSMRKTKRKSTKPAEQDADDQAAAAVESKP